MIKKITAIVADIDGTLVEKGEQMMPLTHEAIENIHRHGVLFGLASGRPVTQSMYRRKESWNLSFDFDIMIGLNGAQLKDRFHDEMGEYYKLPKETMREIMHFMAPLDLPASIYENEYMVTTCIDEHMAASMRRNHTEMYVGDEDRICIRDNFNIIFRYDPERNEEVLAHVAKYPSEKYIAVVTSPGIIEFMDPRINKGLALEKFAERNNIPLEEIMTFGDMHNDVGLMEKGGWSVCLLNGCDDCKKLASDITEYDCNHDGVGHYLYDHVIIPNGWDKD